MTEVEQQPSELLPKTLDSSAILEQSDFDSDTTEEDIVVTDAEQEKALEVLSEVIANMKYARYLPAKKRRETWPEIVDRVKQMHLRKFKDNPAICHDIHWAFQFVLARKVLPAMRTLQFGGLAMELNNMRGFNCTYTSIQSALAFSELMYVLLSGAGVGYDVQKIHIRNIPAVHKPKETEVHVVADSIEGWADAIKALMFAYLEGKPMPAFDYTQIRPEGAPLITSGGQAPGPGPLIEAVRNVSAIMDAIPEGQQMSSLQIHDVICHLANCVVVAGTRRSSLICLFDIDDDEMLHCKDGNWRKTNPQRERANNSVILDRETLTWEQLDTFWKIVKVNPYGEPGIFLTNNSKKWGTNPCGEVALRDGQGCNLVEINGSTIVNQQDFNERARVASFIATLQASYTDFKYLSRKWVKNTEKDALLGIGITGIMSGNVEQYSLTEAAQCAVQENIRVADLIGINRAARLCTIKPSGTTSLFLNCSCGIHDEMIANMRRVLINKSEPMYKFFKTHCPELIEKKKPEAKRDTSSLAFLVFPIKIASKIDKEGEGVKVFLDRVLRFNEEWIQTGHIHGDNRHNVSATASVKPHEWDYVQNWLWENRYKISGITVFPHYGKTAFDQAPYELVDEQRAAKLFKHIQKIDLRLLSEDKDNTKFMQSAACSSDRCERADFE